MATMTWEEIENEVSGCTKCSLSATRTNTVLGVGNVRSRLMFVGEAPGEQEDLQGEPFVGPAGKLLDQMLAAIDLSREDVYIANIVKCRPPGNRDPRPEECNSCLPYLRGQFKLINPRIIVCLGRVAAQVMIEKDFKITTMHGNWLERGNWLFTATYHPSALLRDPSKKLPAWEDFKEIKKKYNSIM